jgi:ADP-ribose pyrophosphatase YjhB (NUDIX family)
MSNSRTTREYPRPSLTVDIVLFAVADDKSTTENEAEGCQAPPARPLKLDGHLELLLIRRGGEPFKGSWALPGGFVDEGESVEQAARRELAEETGIEGLPLEQLYTFSNPARDPRGWVVSCAHLALIFEKTTRPQAGDDALDAAWFHVEYHDDTARERSLALYRGEADRTLDTDTLLAKVKVIPRCEPEIISSAGLAFDHAAIIVYALEHLRSRSD